MVQSTIVAQRPMVQISRSVKANMKSPSASEVGPAAPERQKRDANSDVVQMFGQNIRAAAAIVTLYAEWRADRRVVCKLSDYGVQLRAKQKLRGYYGNISERQFRGISCRPS